MKRSILAGLTAASLVLAACGQPQQSEPAEPTAISAPIANLNIGPNGAGGVSAAVPMSVEALRAAAPNFAVASVDDQVEGEAFTAITLSTGAGEIFRVNPSADRARVHSIVTVSPLARGPTQDIVGQTRFAAAPPEQVEFCASEFVEGAAGFACSTAEDGNFWRVYKLPDGYDGPSDPFDAIDPDVLHDATLAEMRWIAPRAL